MRISNDITDYTLIGTKETDDASNTRIVMSGFQRSGNPGDIDYVSTSTGSHRFFSGGNDVRMTIINNGNVGIGTTTPGYTLDVNGTINSTNISRIIASGSGTSAANFEITGLDLTNYIVNEIIVLWTLNTEGTDIVMVASYNGTTYATANYEVTSYYSTPTIGLTTHDSGSPKSNINIIRNSAGNSTSTTACTGILKINWSTNLGQRSPCFWTSSYTNAGAGCAHTTGTAQNTSSTGNPVKLRLTPAAGNFQAFKWRVIGHL